MSNDFKVGDIVRLIDTPHVGPVTCAIDNWVTVCDSDGETLAAGPGGFRHATPAEKADYHRRMMEAAGAEATPSPAPGQVWAYDDTGGTELLLEGGEKRSLFVTSHGRAGCAHWENQPSNSAYLGTIDPKALAQWLRENARKESQP